jgi:hypothetical protein
MKIKFTNSSIYRYEKKFGSIQNIGEDAGISTMIDLAFFGWQKKGTFDEFLEEVDKFDSINELIEIVTDALAEAFDKNPDKKGN